MTRINCSTKYCRNEAIKGRTICHKCRSRQYKKNHPENYFFNALRNNARRRKKEFSLSLKQFKDFSKENSYMEKKGKNADSLSIDRINVNKGYSVDNIQILSLSNNTKKRNECEYPF